MLTALLSCKHAVTTYHYFFMYAPNRDLNSLLPICLLASSMPGHGLLVSPASSLSFLSNKSKTFLKHMNYSFFTLNSSLNRGAAALTACCRSSAVPAPVAHITSIVFVYRFHKPVCRKGFFYLFFRIE